MNRFNNAIKQIKIRDCVSPFVFLLLLVPSWVFRVINASKKRKLWLVAEQGEARDNGYHFYKYIRKKHPSDYCFYAATPGSAGYDKVAKLGRVIRFGSLRHWLYYMSANLNISSQKSGNPCPIFWYFIHVTLGLYRNRVFLQHGITKDNADWIYWSKTKFRYFICGAKREYDYINDLFGYPNGSLVLSGFPRWDSLKEENNHSEKAILIMPTWRNWLGGEKNAAFETRVFENTDFYRYWSSLLDNEKLIEHIEKENIRVYFYPHINMQKFLTSFSSKSKLIRIISTDSDIQDYFRKCSLMITDYSSVAFDFAYLQKPVIYYQFDQEEYRKRQYAEGYFNYDRDGFGQICKSADEVVMAIKTKPNKKYLIREQKFFNLRDNKNSERVYEAIK